MNRAELREQVFARDNGRCVWPHCGRPAVELAHIHSVGMGGRKSADVMDNCFAACRIHARISDGEYGPGGEAEYLSAHLDLFGADWATIPQDRIAYERAERLAEIVRDAS